VFFDIIKSIFFGIVQGITEWLPISSTGHLILFEEFLKFESVSDGFMEMYRVVIQLGSILAVALLFFNKLNPFSKKKTEKQRIRTYRLWLKVILAVIPAGILGLLFDDVLDSIFYNYITVACTLIIYGILFIWVEKRNRGRRFECTSVDKISFKNAALIGAFQCLSLIPGTSRSGSTILGGIFLGCDRTSAAEFSFFLALPVMLGASLLKIVKHGLIMAFEEYIILIAGFITAFIVSVFVIRFLMDFVKKHNFTVFGWYRIALGIIVFIYFIISLF